MFFSGFCSGLSVLFSFFLFLQVCQFVFVVVSWVVQVFGFLLLFFWVCSWFWFVVFVFCFWFLICSCFTGSVVYGSLSFFVCLQVSVFSSVFGFCLFFCSGFRFWFGVIVWFFQDCGFRSFGFCLVFAESSVFVFFGFRLFLFFVIVLQVCSFGCYLFVVQVFRFFVFVFQVCSWFCCGVCLLFFDFWLGFYAFQVFVFIAFLVIEFWLQSIIFARSQDLLVLGFLSVLVFQVCSWLLVCALFLSFRCFDPFQVSRLWVFVCCFSGVCSGCCFLWLWVFRFTFFGFSGCCFCVVVVLVFSRRFVVLCLLVVCVSGLSGFYFRCFMFLFRCSSV